MSKAEDRYLDLFQDGRLRNCSRKEAFLLGYRQAEKDLGLGWEDIRIILDAENNILHECNDNSKLVIETYPKGEDYYGEILKRFIEKRNDTR